MKLTVNRLSFLKALQTADRAVPSKTTKEILKNVKLLATTNAIVLTGTDGEISLRVDVADVVKADGGECLLPAARVMCVLNELTNDEQIKFEIDKQNVWIRGNASEFRLLTEDPQDFPPVPTFEESAFFQMKAADLRRLIRRTIFASDNESTRYALGGIQVEFAAGRAIFAATDSRRLAVDHAACEVVGPATAPATPPVVPQKAMKLLAAISEDEGDVQIAFNSNGLAVKAGLVTMASQFVQGRFPDWRKVIPTSFRMTLDLVVAPFFSAIRQAMIVRNEESRAIDFSISKGRMRLKAEVADLGSSKIDLPVSYDGEDVTLTFDPVYFADLLKVLDGPAAIQFKLISHEDPGLLQVGDYQYIVMPLSRDK